MSRQLPTALRPRVPPPLDNPYQGTTTSTLPLTHSYSFKSQQPKETNYHLKCTGSIRGNPCQLDQDACFTDEAFTEHNYYDFYDDHGYQTSPNKPNDVPRDADLSYSDDSGSTRLPCYDYDEGSSRRHSRNNFSEHSFSRPSGPPKDVRTLGKDVRRVFPNDTERICQENIQRCTIEPTVQTYTRRAPISRMSDRPTSSMSSGVPSAMIYGCGGKCQTFENVCYYFLQVAFAMGILIGISLGIAGWVLRKSAARNLQVLLYIGALLSLVCALLLSIQCNARNNARIRQKQLRNAKRAPIQLDMLQARVPIHQQQVLVENGTLQSFRGVPVTLVQMSGPGPVLQVQRSFDRQHMVEEQGVPWWRRKDLH